MGGLIGAELAVPLQPGLGGGNPVPTGGTVILPVGVAGNLQLNFEPKSVFVYIGLNATVTFDNVDSALHTVTATDHSFDSGDMAPGDKWTHTFTTVGNYSYYCAYHAAWMKGNVVVKELAGSGLAVVKIPPDTGADTSLNFAPSNLNLVAGVNNTVVFLNEDSAKRTVTSAAAGFDSGDILPGRTWEHTFATGSYSYSCVYHTYMTGAISVSQD